MLFHSISIGIRIRLMLILLVFPFLIEAQNEQDSAWIRDNYTKKELYIPMRDGIKLYTAVYIPNDNTEKHPILMNRTPYSCSPYGMDNFRAFWNNHWRYYMRERYIIVLQDVRGRYMSEGEFEDVRPFNANKTGVNEIDEASDTYDAIDWLVKNLPSNNGRVGIFGISYPGFYSTMAAASAHPALKAVSPQAPVTDWFMGDDFHHKGAFFQMDAFAFYSGFGKPRPQPTTQGSRGFNFPIRDNYTFYLKAGTMGKLSEYMGDSIRFWKQLMSHPNYDAWWQARDARRAMYNIKPAMLVVGGLFDAEDCWGAWNLYKAIEKQSPSTDNRIVMGPWYHGQWASRDGSRLGNLRFGSNTAFHYQNKIELPFFQYHLQQKVADPALPEASIFFTGSNQWREFTQWPPAALETKPIYLHENGALNWTSGSAKAARSYTSDPAHPVPYTEDVHFGRTREYMTDDQRFASRRPDVLTWETEILEEDLTLAGPVFANLMVSLSTTDADFVVKIIDVFPDNFAYPGENLPAGRATGGPYPMNGYQLLVRGEIMRGRFRNSFEKPEAFRPGKMEKVRFELPDVAHTFKKGHRLMIQVQSSWFPLADRNPQQFINIYEAKPDDFLKSDIKVFGNSSIELPILQE